MSWTESPRYRLTGRHSRVRWQLAARTVRRHHPFGYQDFHLAPSDGCSVARRSLSFNKSAAFQVRRSSGGSDHADRYARINIYQIRGRDLSPAASTEAPPGPT